jgi:hypothetical protein
MVIYFEFVLHFGFFVGIASWIGLWVSNILLLQNKSTAHTLKEQTMIAKQSYIESASSASQSASSTAKPVKEHKLLKNYCIGIIAVFILNLFVFGGLAPFLVAALILFIPVLIIDLTRSPKKEAEPEEPPATSQITQEASSQDAFESAKVCPECGATAHGSFCEHCGAQIE